MSERITTEDLLRAREVESLEQSGFRTYPTDKKVLRGHFGGTDTEIFRGLSDAAAFEIAAGGEEALRRQLTAQLFQLVSRANKLLERLDEPIYPEAA